MAAVVELDGSVSREAAREVLGRFAVPFTIR